MDYRWHFGADELAPTMRPPAAQLKVPVVVSSLSLRVSVRESEALLKAKSTVVPDVATSRLSTFWKVFLALLLLLPGCDRTPSPAPPPVAAKPAAPRVTPDGHLDQAQPKLRTMKLYVGAQELITELCTNDVQRMTGMMFRTNMLENEAMLFVFPWPHQTSFYMKNTRVPLDAAYIDPAGVIREIHALHPGDLKGAEASSDNIQFVLETPQGWFKRHNVTTGAVIRTDVGTLGETFFRRK